MLSRPVDSSGDVLPVLTPADLLSGPEAAAAGLSDHLRLFAGDWWEYADRGNEIPDLLSAGLRSERDLETLSGYLSSYVREFPAVSSVSGARASASGHAFTFSCTAHTESGGEVPVQFAYPRA